MSNVIRFLESMGSNPSLTALSPAQYAAVVASLNLDNAQEQALVDRDAVALNDLLGGRRTMYCTLFPAKEDQPLKREDDDEETPDGDGDEREELDPPQQHRAD